MIPRDSPAALLGQVSGLLITCVLKFAFNVCKFVKSNAIVLVNGKSTIGIGGGQPSRLDSCKIEDQKEQKFVPEKIKN